MFIDSQNQLYLGDCAQGDRDATPAEVAAWTLACQPTYQQLRAGAYPPMADYLDAVVKGDTQALRAYTAACLAVKAKYPKISSL
jgi:hypothetical protein